MCLSIRVFPVIVSDSPIFPIFLFSLFPLTTSSFFSFYSSLAIFYFFFFLRFSTDLFVLVSNSSLFPLLSSSSPPYFLSSSTFIFSSLFYSSLHISKHSFCVSSIRVFLFSCLINLSFNSFLPLLNTRVPFYNPPPLFLCFLPFPSLYFSLQIFYLFCEIFLLESSCSRT